VNAERFTEPEKKENGVMARISKKNVWNPAEWKYLPLRFGVLRLIAGPLVWLALLCTMFHFGIRGHLSLLQAHAIIVLLAIGLGGYEVYLFPKYLHRNIVGYSVYYRQKPGGSRQDLERTIVTNGKPGPWQDSVCIWLPLGGWGAGHGRVVYGDHIIVSNYTANWRLQLVSIDSNLCCVALHDGAGGCLPDLTISKVFSLLENGESKYGRNLDFIVHELMEHAEQEEQLINLVREMACRLYGSRSVLRSPKIAELRRWLCEVILPFIPPDDPMAKWYEENAKPLADTGQTGWHSTE